MPQSVNPRSLVCKSCWTSIFSTDEFRTLCKPIRDYDHDGPTYITTVSNIEKAAAAGCTWCSAILPKVNTGLAYSSYYQESAPGASLPPGQLRIGLLALKTDERFAPFTPAGNNVALISVNSWSVQAAIFTTHDSMVGEIVTARNLDNQVNSFQASQQICTWLRECGQHEKCGSIQPSLLPTRVIEVSPEEHPEYPRLYTANGTVGYYAALSYCWGADQKGLTTLHNVNSRFKQLDTSALSQTIQDAITVTKRMDIKYLWIDAICIIQDSMDDKLSELASMGETYQNSSITIVAASASSANQGFLENREPPKPSFQIPFWAPSGKLSSVSLRLDAGYNHNDEPINKRAWTLQEQLLSPRLLIYSSHTLQYHCQEHTVNLGNSLNLANIQATSLKTLRESIPWQLRRSSNSISNFSDLQAIGRAWAQIVGIYSQRLLSYGEDKLPALGAVAALFSAQANMKYLAGLWSGGLLPRLLLWQVLLNKDYVPSALYMAPSWSWASLETPVEYPQVLSLMVYQWHGINIISVDIVLENEALPFSRVTDGFLKLEGFVRWGLFDTELSFRWYPSASHSDDTTLNAGAIAELDDRTSYGMDVLCLAIARRTYGVTQGAPEAVIDGLLISPLLPPVGSTGKYRRVGILIGLQEKDFKGFTREIITLV
ncbi:heterokaryon incompatibility protein [Rutstroemia sp. NJR-2017a BVV2]|nr:heterokaryon incompatibility protein [Rutstroemia sp. NJR-2017a BVV2]